MRHVLALTVFAPALAVVLLASCGTVPEPSPTTDLPIWLRSPILDGTRESDDDPASIVPADATLYVRIENGGGILDADETDPLAREAWNAIQGLIPAGFWRGSAPQLGLDERALLRELFTRDLVLVDQSIAATRRLVVLSRVSEKILRDLPAAARLEPWPLQERVGPYRLWRGESEGKAYLIALGERWLAFTSVDGADHIRRLLVARSAGEPTLDANDAYRDLLSRLPAERRAVMFTQTADGSQAHALVLIGNAPRYEARYAARAPDVEKYVDAVAAKQKLDFGPLPDDVVAAGAVNVLTHEVPSEGVLDMLLFPHSFRARIWERIEPPVLFFLGRLPRAEIAPDPGFDVPVFGIAVRLENDDVARDLDRVCSGIHFLVSLGQLALAEGFFGVEEVKAGGVEYHRADFGPVLRATGNDSLLGKLANAPSARGLTQIAYGRVDDYYVICTQEAFLRRWRDASRSAMTRLTSARDFGAFEFEERDGLIFSALTRGPELSKLVDEAIAFLRESRDGETGARVEPDATSVTNDDGEAPEGDGAAGDSGPDDDDGAARIERPLRWLAGGLEQSSTFSVQVWHGADGLLYGRLLVLR